MNNLELIDWRLVGFSSLWILGLSILLAAFGAADYEASQTPSGARTRDVLRRPRYQAAIYGGMMLVCLGVRVVRVLEAAQRSLSNGGGREKTGL